MDLTFILLLGYFGNVIFLVYFSTWRENGGVQTMPFLHGDFKIFETLEVNNFVSVDFETHVSI